MAQFRRSVLLVRLYIIKHIEVYLIDLINIISLYELLRIYSLHYRTLISSK